MATLAEAEPSVHLQLKVVDMPQGEAGRQLGALSAQLQAETDRKAALEVSWRWFLLRRAFPALLI
jgi:hypothetical protein